MLSYVISEKGKKLPEGYTGDWLTNQYDTKLSLFACSPETLTPIDKMLVVSADMEWTDPEEVED